MRCRFISSFFLLLLSISNFSRSPFSSITFHFSLFTFALHIRSTSIFHFCTSLSRFNFAFQFCISILHLNFAFTSAFLTLAFLSHFNFAFFFLTFSLLLFFFSVFQQLTYVLEKLQLQEVCVEHAQTQLFAANLQVFDPSTFDNRLNDTSLNKKMP